MRPSLPVLFLFLGLFSPAFAQTSARAVGRLGELPPHLTFREGELNLVADYAAAERQIIPLYIVNATDVPKQFLKYTLIFREVLGEDGHWRRGQPFITPECGTGLDEIVEIPSSGFYRTEGWLNSIKGERRAVRYREFTGMHNNLGAISNEGLGVVDPEEVDACRFDSIGVSGGPFEDVALVALNQARLLGRPELLRRRALSRLIEWQVEPRRIDVLKQVIAKAKLENDREAYSLALFGLRNSNPPEWTQDTYWRFAKQEFHENTPLSPLAFDSLMDAPFFPKRKRILLDEIIANPRHSEVERAIRAYPKIVGKAAAITMAQRISRSPKYSASAKSAGSEILAAVHRDP